MDNKRSIGVTILGWYFIIGAIGGGLFSAMQIAMPPPAFLKIIQLSNAGDPLVRIRVTGTVALLLFVVRLFVGINILNLKEKWRQRAIYYILFSTIYSLLLSLFFLKSPGNVVFQIMATIALSAGFIYFLMHPNVRKQFGD